jgi:hypothetical protein
MPSPRIFAPGALLGYLYTLGGLLLLGQVGGDQRLLLGALLMCGLIGISYKKCCDR